MAFRQVETAYQHGYDFGIGVDAPTGSPMGKVVKGVADSVEHAVGGFSQFEITRITSMADLEQSLGIDANVSYGVGLFSASARFNFAKDTKVQTESLFMAVTATVTLAFLQIDDPILEDAAATLVGKPDQFTQRYGDMFVRGVSRGGLFVGVLSIQTASRVESEAIAADLKGTYGLFSADAKAKFENIQKTHSSRLSIFVYKEGGPVGDVLDDPSNPLSLYMLLQRWLKSFQDTPDAASVPYSVTIAPTTIATGPPPPNGADLEHAQDVLVLCARARSETLDRYNLLDYILNNPSRYDFSTSPQSGILAAFNGCQADLDIIAHAASLAIDQPKMANTPADFAADQSLKYPSGLLPETMPTTKPAPSPISAGVWSIKSSMSNATGSTPLLAGDNGKLYAIGRCIDQHEAGYQNGKIEQYDPALNAWSVIAPMPTRLGVAAVLAPGGEILVIGDESRGVHTGSMSAFNPQTSSWRVCKPMPSRRFSAHLAFGGNGRLYAIGGRTGDPASLTQVVEEYDPTNDIWVTKAPMPVVRDSVGIVTAANGKIYVVGGFGQLGGHWALNNYGALSTLEEFDPATNQWTTKTSMRVARGSVGVGAGLNGRIYVIGGSTYESASASYTAVPSVEEYDPATDTWTDKAQLNKARSAPGVATLKDGTIYVAGGVTTLGSQTLYLADVEAFLP